MRDFIIIVSSLGGVFVEADTGFNPVWGHRRWHVQATDEAAVYGTAEYREAQDLAEKMREGEI